MMLTGIQPTENGSELFWSLNLPLQLWKGSDGTFRVLNYMPRKERCEYLEDGIPCSEAEKYTRNAAIVLRNLADLMEAFGRGEIDHVYYPDQTVADAIEQAKREAAD